MSEVQDSNKNALRMEFSKDPAKTIERIQSLVATGNVHESFDQYKNLMEYVVDLTEFSKSTELKNMIFNDLDGQFQGIRGRPESEVAYLFQWKQKIERIEY